MLFEYFSFDFDTRSPLCHVIFKFRPKSITVDVPGARQEFGNSQPRPNNLNTKDVHPSPPGECVGILMPDTLNG